MLKKFLAVPQKTFKNTDYAQVDFSKHMKQKAHVCIVHIQNATATARQKCWILYDSDKNCRATADNSDISSCILIKIYKMQQQLLDRNAGYYMILIKIV